MEAQTTMEAFIEEQGLKIETLGETILYIDFCTQKSLPKYTLEGAIQKARELGATDAMIRDALDVLTSP